MPDFAALNAEAQKLIDAALAADAVQDAVVLAQKDATIADLNRQIAELKGQIPTPTPDPVPDPDPIPTPDPTPADWPNTTNTGAKGTLTPSGSLRTVSNGQIIANRDITGNVTLRHPGAVLRNCRINGSVTVEADDCTVEDCTVNPRAGQPGGWWVAIWVEGSSQSRPQRATIRRNDISGFEDGVVLGTGTHHTVRDNWFHNPIDYRIGDPHIDGIQLHGGSGNYSLIEHNNLDLYPEVSSSITMGNRTAGQGAIGVTVNDNRLNGGTANIYVEGSDSSGVKITNNRFGTRWSKGSRVSGTGISTVTFSGNVDDATGAALRLP